MSDDAGMRPLLPVLDSPVLIAAFGGWNDAGDAATGAIEHLASTWNARDLLTLDSEDYYDYQVNRPTISLDESGLRRITWPLARFRVARPHGAEHHVVLLDAPEPSMRWRSFVDEILAVCEQLGVTMVVSLGALLGDSPHTRPVPVTGTASDPAVAERLGLEVSRYEGPTGIVGVLQQACVAAGLPAVSVWAAVPHYVAAPPNPKATLALVNRVEDVLGLTVVVGDLPEQSRAWQVGVDELAENDEDVAEYIRGLEEASDTADLPEASGEQIAAEFERFLRRREGDA